MHIVLAPFPPSLGRVNRRSKNSRGGKQAYPRPPDTPPHCIRETFFCPYPDRRPPGSHRLQHRYRKLADTPSIKQGQIYMFGCLSSLRGCYIRLLTKVVAITPVTAPAPLVATASLVAAALAAVPATASLEAGPRGTTVLVKGTAVAVPGVFALVPAPKHYDIFITVIPL